MALECSCDVVLQLLSVKHDVAQQS